VKSRRAVSKAKWIDALGRLAEAGGPALGSQTHQEQISTLEAVIRSLPSGAIIADARGKLLFLNDSAKRILGVGLTEVPPEEWSATYGCYLPDRETLYPPEKLPLARALRGEEVLDEEMFIRNEIRHKGTWINISGKPLYGSSGAISGAYVIFQDITAYKKSQEVVERLSSAVEQTADSVVITDTHGTIRYVNPAFTKTTGYSRREVMGKTPAILKSGEHDDEFYRKMWTTILNGGVFTGTLVNRKKCGDLYWSEQTITPMREESGRITRFVSVWKDVTEQRKLQEQEFQLGLAREVQQRFYQACGPVVPGFDLVGRAFPADHTGGDYFDFFPMPGGSVGIAIGDVTGHGFGSALLMAEMRAYTRMVAAAEPDVGKVLQRVGRILYSDLDSSQLITLLLVSLDPRTRSFSYANAGHVPGYLMNASGEVESTLKATGVPLGFDPGATYPSVDSEKLSPGKILTLLTDGITETEAPGGTEYGIERMLKLINEHRDISSAEIAEVLYRDARGFADQRPQQDDITYVVCKAEPQD
jgi:sigma-B regulation protein RsbU (phosphoserine phosphatase)